MKDKTKRHDDRTDLAGEHAFGDLGQIIFLIIFLIIWIGDSFFFKYSIYSQDSIPLVIRLIAGLSILFISGLLVKNGLGIIFGEVREKPEVMENSVFKIVRHPIYLGSILLYLSLIILTFSIASAMVWIIIVIFYYYISKYEEKLLLKKFGTEYKKYMKRVPMFIPSRLKKKNRKLYISILLLFHSIIFTTIMKSIYFNTGGIMLFIIGTVYFILGMRERKEKK